MMSNNEKRICQNCSGEFVITPDDFSFYEKIGVPAPTFCPECRFQRRMTWRNERSLYRRACDLCSKNIISVYTTDSPFPVYCRECWYSDNWDASTYQRDYDFSKSFFEQWKELSLVVPRIAIWQRNVVNSDYANMCGECKNVYLSVSVVVGSENIFYSKGIDASQNIFDSYNIKTSDGCYENIECEKNYNCQHLVLSRNCINSYFLVDCVNCSNCILSSNLRNKEFYINNQQYSKELYFEKLKEMNMGSRKSRKELLVQFDALCANTIYRFANITKSVDSTGNNLTNTKNCINCFDAYDLENVKYCYRGFSNKDCMDFDYGVKTELGYEYSTGALNDYNIRFSYSAIDNVRNSDYTESCISSNNLFGCISLRKKDNAILNKSYLKEEYEALREKIIFQMNELPYIDKVGREYRYGEFFPIELSLFAYNESGAQDFFPLSKTQAIEKGYRWKDPETKNYTATISPELIPDDIQTIEAETFLKEILSCKHGQECNHQCLKVFRMTLDELQFYKKNSIPIPEICPNCRFYERFNKIPPPKLWHRQCMCDLDNHDHTGQCDVEFETSYAPDRPERVYCEKCYQKEVL